jgi:hypothetical protein
LLSAYLLEAITLDIDIQIKKMIAPWKPRYMKKNSKRISMDGMIGIMPYKLK